MYNFTPYGVHCFPIFSGGTSGINCTLKNPQQLQNDDIVNYKFILKIIWVLRLIFLYLILLCVLSMCATKHNLPVLVQKYTFICHYHCFTGGSYSWFSSCKWKNSLAWINLSSSQTFFLLFLESSDSLRYTTLQIRYSNWKPRPYCMNKWDIYSPILVQ